MYSRDHDVDVRELPVSDGIADFASAPLGRCLLGPTFLIWCAAPDLQGAIIWGALDEPAVRELIEVGHFTSHPAISRRRRMLVDCRGVTHVDADAVLGFAALARRRVASWAATVDRQAVVVPEGLVGILIGGALASAEASHPMRFAHDLELAFAYLEHPAARLAHASATRAADRQRGRAVLLSRLAAYLGRDLIAPTLEGSAAALGMSRRTLQRELARLGTSFSDELRGARLTAAKSLLIHSDLKIDAIALKVGLGTASRMSAMLRRELDVTASDLRARFRGERNPAATPCDPSDCLSRAARGLG